jgi:hypothetical protein
MLKIVAKVLKIKHRDKAASEILRCAQDDRGSVVPYKKSPNLRYTV